MKKNCLPLETFLKQFFTEEQGREYLASVKEGMGMIAQNAATAIDTCYPTNDTNVPSVGIRPQ